MNNFIFHIPTEIHFGKGQIRNLDRLKEYGKKVLLVYGGGSIRRNGLYDTVCEILEKAGLEVFELPGVEPNPRISSVRKGVEICRRQGVDCVLAVGGGSVIDCAKMVAAGALYDGDAWDLVKKSSNISGALPIFAVLTMAATGSEMDRYAVISNPDTNEKLGVFSPWFYPKLSVLDPEYTYTVPKEQTAAGVADIMSHIFERYFNNVPGAYLLNRLNEALLKTCIHYGPIALREPKNYEARANIMWASTLAIDGVTWRGNEVMSTCHPIEHQLSAYYDMTHGTGLAILTPVWMEYILSEKTADRFAEYGINVWGLDPEKDSLSTAKTAIEKTKEFFRSMGLPGTLAEAGIHADNLEQMARKACRGLDKAYVPLAEEDVLAIYRAAR